MAPGTAAPSAVSSWPVVEGGTEHGLTGLVGYERKSGELPLENGHIQDRGPFPEMELTICDGHHSGQSHVLAYCSPSDGSSHRLELIARENSDAQDHPVCRCRRCDRDRFRSVGCRAHQCPYYPLARDLTAPTHDEREGPRYCGGLRPRLRVPLSVGGIVATRTYNHLCLRPAGWRPGWPRRVGQLVICAARISADDKSRPASPVTLKSAGRGASAIHGGPRVLYLARPARSADLPEHRVAPSTRPVGRRVGALTIGHKGPPWTGALCQVPARREDGGSGRIAAIAR